MSRSKEHPADLPSFAVPLVIAVTGHRDLLESQAQPLKARAEALFAELRRRFPDSRITVMSPLAEGADMLVAEVAVDMGLDLIVPLPKPRDEYLLDFVDTAAKLRFERLCHRAADVFELDVVMPPAPAGLERSSWESAYPYAQLGVFLSSHCHLLLAIWDGKPSTQLGGTAQVVTFHQDDVMPGVTRSTVASQRMLVDDESDLVFHVVCSRDQDRSPPPPGMTLLEGVWYTKDKRSPRAPEMPLQHQLIFERSNEFSADARRFASRIDAAGSSLLKQSGGTPQIDGAERIDKLFRAADWLAIRYQKLTLRVLRVSHLLAFSMGLMFLLYSELESWRYYLIAFIGFFLTAVAIQHVSKRGGWHRKYLDYRTLAEGLRVQLYWAMAGVTVENRWKFPHDSFLQSQNPEFGWIRNVMRVAGMRCDAAPRSTPAGLQFALRQWVGDHNSGQLGYFRRESQSLARRLVLTERLGKVSLFLSVLIVLFFVAFGSSLSDSLGSALTVVMGSALLLYGVREGYTYATAVKELVKQYEFMLGIYANAHRRLSLTDDLAEQRLILLALGQSALDEHSDWLLMHRDRSLEEGEIWRMGS